MQPAHPPLLPIDLDVLISNVVQQLDQGSDAAWKEKKERAPTGLCPSCPSIPSSSSTAHPSLLWGLGMAASWGHAGIWAAGVRLPRPLSQRDVRSRQALLRQLLACTTGIGANRDF